MLRVTHPVGKENRSYGTGSVASLDVVATGVHLASHSVGRRSIGDARMVQDAPREGGATRQAGDTQTRTGSTACSRRPSCRYGKEPVERPDRRDRSAIE